MNRQLALGVRLRDSSIFTSYYAGANRPLVDALLALPLRGPPACIFLHGAAGVGKTHLLQSLCAFNSERGQPAAYLPLQELGVMGPEVLSGHGELTCVCVDDVEAIAGRRDWELALFALHQQLEEQQGHLVLASALPPAAAGIRLRDLASRMAGGLVLTVRPLDDDGRVAALQLRAHLRGCELPDDTAHYLLRRLPRDMSALCAFLDQLDGASLAAQRRLTIPFVREVLAANERAAVPGGDFMKSSPT